MPKFNVHDVALPKINLTPERQAALIAEVDAVVQNTLELRGAFAAGGRQLDTTVWKHVKTKDDVRAYRSRRALHGVELTDSRADTNDVMSSSSSSNSQRSTLNKLTSIVSSNSSDGERRRIRKTSRPPAVVISGIIDGTAEDAALGMLADTEQHAMMRQSYLGTELEDARLLFVLVPPTAQNPSNFIGLKWGCQSYGRFSHARDFLFLEASGLMKGPRGETVAYGVRQSVDIQVGDTGRTVELFSRAFIEMEGDMSVNAAAAAYAESLMALVNSMECATSYKLTWLMKQATRQVRPGPSSVIGRMASASHCATCTRSLNKLSTLLLHRGGTCQVCRRVLCGKCSVNKKISVGIGADVMKKSILFCLECLLEAKKLPARGVAVEMLSW
ncbi:hypothetical protein BBJ29_002581 [Phytophthora kernoviae]|uniref:FYVE-type domain-containing protein n=1 Tax=Phytophthora kernoviae TaxID=325452 RepID=A0A3F2RPN4_9STRA|nr:hypothetical protein BBJ29_002581 [Phytophthora kernoviae]RLN61430.1 hypothetical protein BBP00_00005438 [Phytophthora kernoviae]